MGDDDTPVTPTDVGQAIEDDEPVLECHRHGPLCFGLDDHEVEL